MCITVHFIRQSSTVLIQVWTIHLFDSELLLYEHGADSIFITLQNCSCPIIKCENNAAASSRAVYLQYYNNCQIAADNGLHRLAVADVVIVQLYISSCIFQNFRRDVTSRCHPDVAVDIVQRHGSQQQHVNPAAFQNANLTRLQNHVTAHNYYMQQRTSPI